MSRLAIITTHPIQYYAPVFKAIAKRNCDTKVFYTWGDGSVNKYDPDFQVKIEWDIPLLDGYQYQFLTNISSNPGTDHFKGIINPDAISAINEFNPDVLLVYGWAWHSHLKIIRHFSGKKKIWFRGDSTLIDETKSYKKLLRYIVLRWIYRHIDLAFYVGTRNKEYFKHFGLKEGQLKFAPHSIDNCRFLVDRSADAKAIRAQFDIPDSGILILFAGKLEGKKDPITLLEAFEGISNKDVFLLFAGNGILEQQLKNRAETSPKKRQIFFMNFQNQSAMPALYQACDLFCLPSVGPGETWGLAVNEAMAAGRAVVVSDKVGSSVDLVQEGKNGSIFNSKNKAQLTKKLNDLTMQRIKLQELGKASRKIIESWSIEKQVSLILEELNSVQCRK